MVHPRAGVGVREWGEWERGKCGVTYLGIIVV